MNLARTLGLSFHRARLGWLALLPAFVAPRQSSVLEVHDLRFVPQRGAVIRIDPSSSIALPAGMRGELLAEVGFTTDLVRGNGAFYTRDLDCLWKVTDDLGQDVVVRGVDAGSEWNGVDHPVQVAIDSVDPLSGRCEGLMSLPVGGFEPNWLGVRTRYPLFPDSSTTITALIGWRGRLRLDEDHVPVGVLAQAVVSFPTEWPEVWIGNESPRGFPAVEDDGFEYVLRLRSPHSFPRSFTLTAQPNAIATVMTPEVTIDAGETWAFVRIRADRPGEFRLLVHEKANLVARSSIDTAVLPAIFADAAHPEGFTLQSDGGTRGVDDWFCIGEDQECVEGWVPGGPHQPTFEWCMPCQAQPNPQPTCPGETSSGFYIWWDAKCVDGGDGCVLAVAPIPGHYYTNTDKRETPCFTVASTGGFMPWGVGASGTVTRTYSSWCCKYSYGGTSPGNAPGARTVCSGQ